MQGQTSQTNFPVLNAFKATDPSPSGTQEAFVTELNPASGLVYSTYLGCGAGTETLRERSPSAPTGPST